MNLNDIVDGTAVQFWDADDFPPPACPHCLNLADVIPEQLDPDRHISARWIEQGPWKVTLDGVDISDRCYEAFTGEDGWAIVMHVVDNGDGTFSTGLADVDTDPVAWQAGIADGSIHTWGATDVHNNAHIPERFRRGDVRAERT